MKFPFVLNEEVLTVFVNGEPHQVRRSNSNFERVKEAVNDPSLTISEVLAVLDKATAIQEAFKGHGEATIESGVLKWNGHEVHSTLGRRVADIVGEGFDVDPWLRFVENVYANPNEFSRTELYDFLEEHELPITEDGHFLAYKKVTGTYADLYTRTFSNRVGMVQEMPREAVDHDRHRACSQGFHFCSKDYLASFGGDRLMILKINPADVVSIPSDHNFAKGRTWRYEVIGEIAPEEVDSYDWDPVLYDDDREEDEGYDDEYEMDEDNEYVNPFSSVMEENDPEFERLLAEEKALSESQLPETPANRTVEQRKRSRSVWDRLRGRS